ncbi:hypothetical protein Cni_G19505 [Canna indica]|uniref:Proteasome subunit alpha type-2 n=1 Tax=Canna indica TaxID=4628 RepID=A0AAQ3QFB5_9LILI|nr:hypothetical protein Cni_G19505 [Canna indica]
MNCDVLQEIAAAKGKTLAQVHILIVWLKDQEVVSPNYAEIRLPSSSPLINLAHLCNSAKRRRVERVVRLRVDLEAESPASEQSRCILLVLKRHRFAFTVPRSLARSLRSEHRRWATVYSHQLILFLEHLVALNPFPSIFSILFCFNLSAAFSPSGKLVQIEHALTAVGSGQTSLGIKAANGVVIATEKKLPSILVDETSVQKIQLMTTNIGVVYSGMGPDSRVLVRKSRKQAQQYFRLYKESIPVTQLVRETAAVMQEFTQSGGVRPFGVSLLVAGYDDNGPQLYQVDPSGSYFSWKASAMGKNVSNAKTFLEKRYTDDMELDDAVHTAILTLKEGFQGQISGKNIEIGIIGADRKFRVLTPAEIDDYLAEVE